ncbi:MAG: gamma-glutamyltransferase family protein [Hyphomicrobiales bacterium]|nr:MAG: gamma-glutamyltransferase family protein [Hyphomicrobiales bacterium]
MLFALLAALVLGPGGEARAWDRSAPEGASGWFEQPVTRTRTTMVATAHPQATEAGREILRRGGSAADAAIAVQFVLGLVEPQSSGLGGGAFALAWDNRSATLRTFDGRETAPAAATASRFLVDGKPMPLRAAVLSGLSVGTPGTVQLLETLHRTHGRLPWADLVERALRLAEGGFRVSRRLSTLLSATSADTFAPEARAYFFDRSGSARPEGYLLRNPAYADLLRRIARDGAAAFYAGPVAEGLVTAVRSGHGRGGDLARVDLEAYHVVERPPLCFAYRSMRICSMGPPSSGGIALAQTLALIAPMPIGDGPRAAMNARALHAITEAEKLAFADRDRYVADPDAVRQPPGLLDPVYLGRRRELIDPKHAMARPRAGEPAEVGAAAFGQDATVEMAGTTHFAVVDADRNVISMTSTIEAGFGSRLWANGMLLNNELTDFSFLPVDGKGQAIANAVGPGKRPRSSMAPTIIFDADGKPWAALGSVGGPRIPLYVIKTIVALIDWKLDAQAAASLMNFGSRGGPFEIEIDDPKAVWHALKMKPLGHKIHADLLTSGTQVIRIMPDGSLEGGADPRREGIALGD